MCALTGYGWNNSVLYLIFCSCKSSGNKQDLVQETDKYIALWVQLVCMVMLRIHWNVTNTKGWVVK